MNTQLWNIRLRATMSEQVSSRNMRASRLKGVLRGVIQGSPHIMRTRQSTFFLAGVSLAVLAAGAAAAQDAPAPRASSDVVIVTGTRTEGRTALQTLAPVDVISSAQLESNGSPELNVALSYAVPSFCFPQPSLTDGTDTIRPATLRGLGPDQTLTLVNGKRRHVSALVNVNGSVGRGSAAVDLNTIPTSAIGSVEILRDGASAQYGSDAIAGVINVRLREAREGGGATLTYGQNVTTVPLLSGDRKERDGETLSLAGWAGLPLGSEGFLTISGEFRDRSSTNRSGPDPRQQYPTANDPREASFNRLNHRFGNPNMQDITLLANAGIPFGNGNELYGFASYQSREADSAGFYRRALDARNVLAIYPDGFLPMIAPEVEDISFGGGLRAELGEWSADASLVYGRNQIDYTIKNTLNTSLGAASPTEFYAGQLAYSQAVANFDLVRQYVMDGLYGPLNVALGLEGRFENFEIGAGEPGSYIQGAFPGPQGSQVFPGFQPANEVDVSRQAFSAYADVEADITSNLTLSGAIRYENYSDFGYTFNGRLAGRLQVTEALAFRASVSSGFRAPSLHQSHFTSTATVFTGGVPDETGTFPVGSPTAIALGASPLEPETSVNYSLGAVFATGGFSLTIDAYRIEIDDRILLSENLDGVSRADIGALLPAGITRARFFLNAADSVVEGVDIVASYAWTTEQLGDFDATFGYNYNTVSLSNIQSTGVLSALTPPPTIFGRQSTLRLEEGTPKDKFIFGLDWSRDRLGGFARATRFGETLSPGGTAASDVQLSAQWVVDLEGNFDLTDRVNFALGANNVFDTYPENVPNGLNFNGILAFSSFSPAGFNGRYIYGRVSVSW
ncbi:MAG: TonB-dependent receptor [Oceanicaulis sp.]|nr:TonB-dependent receptor [Oceanicaulis sp.]